MKFKVGDKVREYGTYNESPRKGTILKVDEENTGPRYKTTFGWRYEQYLELIEPVEIIPIRTFLTGATRDTAVGKLSYMKALSPEVLEVYVMYLDKHRMQSDGSMRAFDNWKLGIDKWTYLDSLLRHDKAIWKFMLGYEVSDNHGPTTLLDSLMAVIFNATGLAYELLIEEGKVKRNCQNEGKIE